MIASVSKFFRDHPLLKGMAVYSVIWPSSSYVQQIINKEEFDVKKTFRFFLFGTFFVAPSLYGWIKLSTAMWPYMNLKSGIQKAMVEQFSYGPMAGVSFFTLMTLMEGRPWKDVRSELSEKFPKTYKVGFFYWQTIQIFNFSFIKERNRVPFVAVCSFIWTIFLAYMKEIDSKSISNESESILNKSPFNLVSKFSQSI